MGITAIEEFCEKRRITKTIQDAFVAYCRSTYALKFQMKDGDTIKSVVDRMTAEQVSDAWMSFVSEFRELISYTQ